MDCLVKVAPVVPYLNKALPDFAQAKLECSLVEYSTVSPPQMYNVDMSIRPGRFGSRRARRKMIKSQDMGTTYCPGQVAGAPGIADGIQR